MLREVRVRVRRRETPVARIIVAAVVHVQREMLGLLFLHVDREDVTAIFFRHGKVRAERGGLRVVEHLDLRRQFRNIDRLVLELRQHAADGILAPMLIANDLDLLDIELSSRRGLHDRCCQHRHAESSCERQCKTLSLVLHGILPLFLCFMEDSI